MNKYNDHIKAIKNNYPTSAYSALCEALDCAVDLMRKEMESAEKCECTLQEPCEYCTTVDWETDSPYDRGKLIDKKELTRATVINGEELLSLDYRIGYFVVTERKIINYCPMCGRKLEEAE